MTQPKKPPTSNQPKKQMRFVEASRAIWQTKANLTTSELLLLQALGSHADEHFECFPNTGRLAHDDKVIQNLSDPHTARAAHEGTPSVRGEPRRSRSAITTACSSLQRVKKRVTQTVTSQRVTRRETMTFRTLKRDILYANGDKSARKR